MESADTVTLALSPSHNALQRYVQELQLTKKDFSQSSVDDVLVEIQNLEERHSAKSKFRRFGRRIDPLITFLSRYGPVIDTLVQFDTSPSALVWGAVKVLLEVGCF
jgi:hypothetical protein